MAASLASLSDVSTTKEADSCPICTSVVTDPKLLSCGHTFCLDCIQKHCTASSELSSSTTTTENGEESNKVLCPVCRQVINLTVEGLESAKKNGTGSSEALEDIVTRITSPKRPNCDVCRYKDLETPARDHCAVCTVDLCAGCKADHDRHSASFRGHSTVPISQRDRTNTVMLCEVHRAETVRYFCATCMAPLCAVCAVVEHNRHDTAELTIAVGDKRERIKERVGGLIERVGGLEEAMARLEDLSAVREASVKKTKSEIERQTAKIMAAVEKRRDQLIEDLERYHAASTKAMNIEKDSVNLQLANLKSLWKFAVKLTEPSQAVQLLASYGDVDRMVDSFLSAPDKPHQPPRDLTSIAMFVPKESLAIGDLQTCELSPQLLQRLESSRVINGGATSPVLGRRAAGVVSPGPGRRVKSPTPWDEGCGLGGFGISPSMNLKYLTTARLVWKVDKIGSKPGEINEAYDVTMTPNGTVVVAEWLNQRLQVFDCNGNSRDIIGQGVVQPWGITLTRDNNLAVTDEKDRTVRIFQLLTSSGARAMSPTPSRRSQPASVKWKKNLFGCPRGIAANSAGQLIVTDTQHGRHTVSIHLPADGKCFRQFDGAEGCMAGSQFQWPRYVATDAADRIFVSDGGNHCVRVLDSTGQFMFRVGSGGMGGSGDGQLKHPRGVCADPRGGIIVADQDNNRVCLFGADGTFQRHLLSVHKPWGVAISEGGVLAVTHKQSLSVYKVFDPLP